MKKYVKIPFDKNIYCENVLKKNLNTLINYCSKYNINLHNANIDVTQDHEYYYVTISSYPLIKEDSND